MNKSLSFWHICLIFTGIFLSFGINAEMYKWVDEDGNTHYTQSPPSSDVNVETIKQPPSVDTKSATKELDKQKQTVDKLREDRISAKEDKQKAGEDAAAKQQKCNQAKKRLASYQRPRVNVENPDGTLRVLSEEERQSEIAKSKETINKLCN